MYVWYEWQCSHRVNSRRGLRRRLLVLHARVVSGLQGSGRHPRLHREPLGLRRLTKALLRLLRQLIRWPDLLLRVGGHALRRRVCRMAVQLLLLLMMMVHPLRLHGRMRRACRGLLQQLREVR